MSNSSTVAQFASALGLALLAVTALSQAPRTRAGSSRRQRVTDALVAEALAANLGLDAVQAANVDQRLAALDQARAEYLPQIDLNLRYSEASGGRTIEVPAARISTSASCAIANRTRTCGSRSRSTTRASRRSGAAPRTATTQRARPRGLPAAARPRRAPGLLPLARRARSHRRARGDARRSRARTSASTTACTGTARSRATSAARRGRAAGDRGADPARARATRIARRAAT